MDHAQVFTVGPYIWEVDYASTTNPVYIGFSSPGTPTSAAGWQISFLTYDVGGNLLSRLFANGTRTFNNVWDNRAALAYS